jgi:hypothetical protein
LFIFLSFVTTISLRSAHDHYAPWCFEQYRFPRRSTSRLANNAYLPRYRLGERSALFGDSRENISGLSREGFRVCARVCADPLMTAGQACGDGEWTRAQTRASDWLTVR